MKELLKLAFCSQGYCHLIQENLDNVSCCKMKEKISHQIMEFRISLEGRTVPTMLVLDHMSSKSGSLKEQSMGPQGEDIIVMV